MVMVMNRNVHGGAKDVMGGRVVDGVGCHSVLNDYGEVEKM